MERQTVQAGDRPHWSEPDVLIIGAGASGAAVAWSLAEAGFRVVCLEQGDWVAPASLPANGADWEVRRLTDFHPDPNVRRRPEDYPVNDAASTFSPLMFNAVGGSTGAAIGAGLGGAAGSAMTAKSGKKTEAAIGGGLGAVGGSVAGRALGGSTGSVIGAGLGGAAGGAIATELSKDDHDGHGKHHKHRKHRH